MFKDCAGLLLGLDSAGGLECTRKRGRIDQGFGLGNKEGAPPSQEITKKIGIP